MATRADTPSTDRTFRQENMPETGVPARRAGSGGVPRRPDKQPRMQSDKIVHTDGFRPDFSCNEDGGRTKIAVTNIFGPFQDPTTGHMPLQDWTAFFRAGAEIPPLLKVMLEKCCINLTHIKLRVRPSSFVNWIFPPWSAGTTSHLSASDVRRMASRTMPRPMPVPAREPLIKAAFGKGTANLRSSSLIPEGGQL